MHSKTFYSSPTHTSNAICYINFIINRILRTDLIDKRIREKTPDSNLFDIAGGILRYAV